MDEAGERLNDLNLDKDEQTVSSKGKRDVVADREPGKSLLPMSRVQKIIKADEDMMMVQKEAVLLISLATERFMKRFAEANAMAAQRDKRTTTQHKDLANVVRRADEYAFLEEMVPWIAPNPTGKRIPKAAQSDEGTTRTALDNFLDGNEDAPEVIMRDDGTMVAE